MHHDIHVINYDTYGAISDHLAPAQAILSYPYDQKIKKTVQKQTNHKKQITTQLMAHIMHLTHNADVVIADLRSTHHEPCIS